MFPIVSFAEVYVDITMRAAKASANNGWPVMELKREYLLTIKCKITLQIHGFQDPALIWG